MRIAASALVRVIGFSTSTCTPCSRKNRANEKCSAVVAAIVTASTLPTQLAMILKRARSDLGRDAAAALGIAVANADELDVVERAVLLRVKPAEIADADDRRAELAHRVRSRARSCG